MKKKYLVIGAFVDNAGRFADEFMADDAQDAEKQALMKAGLDLLIAGTIELKKGLVIEMAS